MAESTVDGGCAATPANAATDGKATPATTDGKATPATTDGSTAPATTDGPTTPPAVHLSGLTIAYRTDAGELPAVAGVDMQLHPGTITGLVGESGSGKSTLALALLGAVTNPGRVTAGSITIDGVGDVTQLGQRALRRARGARIGYVFQAAQNSLNPLKQVGKQVLDLGRSHDVKDTGALMRDASRLLERMGLPAERVLRSYQHELSGGMRQRVGIMLALVLNAHVLVLDEPTTALDMITQANILGIIKDVHAERGLTTLVVTHDVGVVAEVSHRLAVMYGGRLVEQGPTTDVLAAPLHPYTRGLITAIPRLTGDINDARPLPGRPPTLGTVPTVGCVFRERCPLRMAVCDDVDPVQARYGDRQVACHAVDQEAAGAPAATNRDLSALLATRTAASATAVAAARVTELTAPTAPTATPVGAAGAGTGQPAGASSANPAVTVAPDATGGVDGSAEPGRGGAPAPRDGQHREAVEDTQ